VGGWVDGWVDEWMDGWMDGSKSRFKDCLQQSKIKSSIVRSTDGKFYTNLLDV
jgi:hypothetical protein